MKLITIQKNPNVSSPDTGPVGVGSGYVKLREVLNLP